MKKEMIMKSEKWRRNGYYENETAISKTIENEASNDSEIDKPF